MRIHIYHEAYFCILIYAIEIPEDTKQYMKILEQAKAALSDDDLEGAVKLVDEGLNSTFFGYNAPPFFKSYFHIIKGAAFDAKGQHAAAEGEYREARTVLEHSNDKVLKDALMPSLDEALGEKHHVVDGKSNDYYRRYLSDQRRWLRMSGLSVELRNGFGLVGVAEAGGLEQ